MSSPPKTVFVQDAWQSTKNARTLRAYMALRNQEIAERIVDLRKRRHLPQSAVYEALGVSERGYQNWEAGRSKPNYTSLQKLAEFFAVSESYILEGVDDRPIIEGVPEQLDGVYADFSVRVDQVEATLAAIDDELRGFRAWSERALERIVEERAVALAHANDMLAQIDAKVERLMHLVDQGLFTPREDGGSRDDQIGLGAALAAAFQAEPRLAGLLREQLRPQEDKPRTGRAPAKRRASG